MIELFLSSLPAAIIILLAGIFLLYKGADLLVDGAAALALSLGVPALVVALTIVSYGTTTPEFSASLIASLKGSYDVAVGNIVGTVIANTLLILGISAIIRPLKVTQSIVRREVPILILAAVLLTVLSVRFELNIIGGVILLVAFSLYMIFILRSAWESKSNNLSSSVIPRWKCMLLIILGFCGVIFGAMFLVDSAIFLARSTGISEAVIGLTLVAVGTSLPELATSTMASYKGKADISIGNIVGANIIDALLILGVCSIIVTLTVTPKMLINMGIMCAVCVTLAVMLYTGYVLSRKEGFVLLTGYALYLIYLFMF